MSTEALFKPVTINGLSLRSRVIMGSMHVGLESMDRGDERLIAFYRERARHEVGLIVTGGAAVNPEGSGGVGFMTIYEPEDVERWKPLTKAIDDEGSAIALQLFHAGRYAYKALTQVDPVAPSAIQSPINPDVPVALSDEGVRQTIRDFANGAKNAKEAGFHAVEIMGSEGYLINQFISPVTNQRDDDWGGSFEKRIRLPIEVTKAVREAVGPDYPVIFRMSGLDLIEGSTTDEETLELAKALEEAGADVLNVGIGWHESRVPTISMKVPRMQFVPVAERIADAVGVPVVASNRINDPRDAAKIIANSKVALVSMARPFLADPAIVSKGKEGRFDDINTCIACNQACLDHVFEMKPASCLVNPEAGRELDWALTPADTPKQIVIVGAGPGGLEAARAAAERGHKVTLIDEKSEIGGQLNYSKNIPGKQEFFETLRYYRVQLDKLGVNVILSKRVSGDDPLFRDADEVIVATGITPRVPDIPGIGEGRVLGYRDVFEGASPGEKVTIIGGGGIACDAALYMMERGTKEVTLLQRSKSFAKGIGKTTRWATILELKQKGITMIGGIESYSGIEGGTVTFVKNGKEEAVDADTIVLAAGQLVNNTLADELKATGKPVHIIGGAKDALGLDAKQAIYDGAALARAIQ
ncbi:oxidoreductase [Salisediminibacterium selenitireducens]|uniref:NADH:flavin oxidoreductase/NADH oxidase n=1 Tax=Bacillus selenitireducens (strain ATCC 700615 / DSM 15326 / MLS10) TaxID=439292 RepID=D6Y1B7_BACIE|nr:FAD-dependent oxidoreductase [Salisediminibacterium selenitireducens]ADI00704.1 NADH:flavin oxidoreductase/NADH oxidase [[Bacillus] selenitireducens MLS10]